MTVAPAEKRQRTETPRQLQSRIKRLHRRAFFEGFSLNRAANQDLSIARGNRQRNIQDAIWDYTYDFQMGSADARRAGIEKGNQVTDQNIADSQAEIAEIRAIRRVRRRLKGITAHREGDTFHIEARLGTNHLNVAISQAELQAVNENIANYPLTYWYHYDAQYNLNGTVVDQGRQMQLETETLLPVNDTRTEELAAAVVASGTPLRRKWRTYTATDAGFALQYLTTLAATHLLPHKIQYSSPTIPDPHGSSSQDF